MHASDVLPRPGTMYLDLKHEDSPGIISGNHSVAEVITRENPLPGSILLHTQATPAFTPPPPLHQLHGNVKINESMRNVDFPFGDVFAILYLSELFVSSLL